MAVLLTPPFLTFFDDNGAPLAGGKLYTYAAGTTTEKATYTDESGDTEAANPIILDSAGRATVWISGSYKFRLYDADDNLIEETDDVTAFNATGVAASSYFETFSGTGSQTEFTTSEDLGTDEKAIFVWVYDSGSTEGYEIQPPTAYTIDGTTLTFTSAPVSGTGNIYVAAPNLLVNAASASADAADTSATNAATSATAAQTAQTAAEAAQTAAETAETNAETAETNAETAQTAAETAQTAAETAETNAATSATNAAASEANAASTVGFPLKYTFSTTTSMADPGSGVLRLNHATISSVTAIAFDALCANSGTPDVSDYIAAWAGSSSTIKGYLSLSKGGAPQNFAVFSISAVTDNTGWLQVNVAYVTGAGSFSASDDLFVGFSRTGDQGSSNGGMVLLSTASASNSASIDVESDIDDTYEHYIFEGINIVPQTDGALAHLLTSSNGGSSYDSGSGNYGYSYEARNSGLSNPAASNSDTKILIGPWGLGSAAGESFNFTIDVWNPAGTNYTVFGFRCHSVDDGGLISHVVGAGARLFAADVDAIRFVLSTGNIASGEFKFYGVKKA